MLKIRWTPPDALEISALAIELREIMIQIRDVASGKVNAAALAADATGVAHPYQECLNLLKVERGIGPASISVEGNVVHAVASAQCLYVFATYFDFEDDSPIGTIARHNHFEYFEGNKWIASDSVPLVIAVGKQQ